MGLFFNLLTGGVLRDEQYSKTLNHCLRKIREKADDMGVNLNDYYNTSNADSFQEKSILFFLANAAIVDQNDSENIIHIRGMDQDALTKVLKSFLIDNGIRSMDLRASIADFDLNEREVGKIQQALFGRDFIHAEKHGTYDPDAVLNKFIQSLVDEVPYGRLMNDKNPVY